jgi:16S rRNA (guanine527-N7)-methyltransferase
VAYADRLATEGVVRGLIGPREVPRLWDRHILNCALVSDLIPAGAAVVDVGSGAGLPGLVLAIRRPDLRVTLLEPMRRRVEFLTETVDQLGLDSVTVVRGRAEASEVRSAGIDCDLVVARAVAPLDRLVKWCLPLVPPGGHLLALKGVRAEAELAEHVDAVRQAGGSASRVVRLGDEGVVEPTWLVDVTRGRASGRGTQRGRR